MGKAALYVGLAALLLAVMAADYHLLSPRGESGPISHWILLTSAATVAILGAVIVLIVAVLAMRDARRRAAARKP